jgi:tRNA pseudouridine13 synthase
LALWRSFRELPFAYGGPLGAARLRDRPEDFQVDERLSFEPDGAGEHHFLRIRKTGHNTQWVARQLARWAGVSASAVGYAGLKDRHAVTTQWFSVQLPGKPLPDPDSLAQDGIELLEVTANSRKLRRGAIGGNCFQILLRQPEADRSALEQRLALFGLRGVPNYFGEQRFGHDGQNIHAGLEMLSGRLRPKRFERGIYLSALRSQLFNQCLASRVLQASWEHGLAGDVVQLRGSHSMFLAETLDQQLQQRLLTLDVHVTGPLPGKSGRSLSPVDLAAEHERECLASFADWLDGLQQVEQDRRALRAPVDDLSWQWRPEGDLLLSFSLDAGCYATAVLRELVHWSASPADATLE